MAVGGAAQAKPCEAPDHLTRTTGGKECLVIHTFGAGPGTRTLVVFVHGDGSRGGPSDYLSRAAKRVAGAGVAAVVLIRPGYHDSEGAASTGTSYRRRGDGYRDHVIAAVADAVDRLRTHHGAERVVYAGHSGGAAIGGVVLGRYPGLLDAADLAACPCDVGRWRAMRGRRPWPRSRSPHAFVDAVAADVEVVALTGSKDTNTRSVLAAAYVKRLARRGIAATFSEVDGAGHNGVARSTAFHDAIARLAAAGP